MINKMSFINKISEIIMEEKRFDKKYKLILFIKELEDHLINLYGSTENGEIYESSEEDSETNESDITDEDYEINKEVENGIEFFMLK